MLGSERKRTHDGSDRDPRNSGRLSVRDCRGRGSLRNCAWGADTPFRLNYASTIEGGFNGYLAGKSAQAAGCKVAVIFVHRNPVEAYLQGVLTRAAEQGRTVTIEGHVRMHKDSQKTFLKVHKSFIDNPNVSFMVLSNTGHESELYKADIDYLKAVKYDSQAIIKAIKEGLDYALSEKLISEALYNASCGIALS